MSGFELEFVEWLRGRQRQHQTVRLGIGDDMAIVRVGQQDVLLTSDMLLDSVHFDTARQPLSKIGRKAIACGLSDCAAMAVRPIAATVSVALPSDSQMAHAQELYEGMFALAGKYDLAIVGGDTTTWSRPLAIDVAVMAIPYAGIEPVTRSGAKPGDTLYVTGPLGGSLLGRHLDFTPRVHEAQGLARRFGERLHAMMDISDGLALDLWRMCQASNVGATLDEQLLQPVISDDARLAAAQDRRTPLDHALADGEDFELLVAVEGDVSDTKVTLHPVGEVTSGGLFLRRLDGRIEPLEPKGYVH
jgi:thiamine-monophosphate kinase